MTDHKFTEDEIKMGLRCLSGEIILCKFCAFSHLEDRGFACKKNVANAALTLINRQEAETERLNTVHADMTESLRLAAEANKDMQAEIAEYQKHIDNDIIYVKRVEAEAIKEFAERLRKRARMPLGTLYGTMVYLKDIDTLVKEMMEENK